MLSGLGSLRVEDREFKHMMAHYYKVVGWSLRFIVWIGALVINIPPSLPQDLRFYWSPKAEIFHHCSIDKLYRNLK